MQCLNHRAILPALHLQTCIALVMPVAFTQDSPHLLPAGLTPFLVKLLSEDELTTKQALHLIDLQLREQVSFQDVHELYMLNYITSIPSPHLRTCQLLVGLNTAARLVQILKGTAGSGEQLPAVTVFVRHPDAPGSHCHAIFWVAYLCCAWHLAVTTLVVSVSSEALQRLGMSWSAACILQVTWDTAVCTIYQPTTARLCLYYKLTHSPVIRAVIRLW